jgi:hypothetical protein
MGGVARIAGLAGMTDEALSVIANFWASILETQ